MRKFSSRLTAVAVLTLSLNIATPTNAQSRPHLVTELTSAASGPMTLDVTFYAVRPESDQAEETLRQSLEAATVMHSAADITAKAWFRASADSSDRQSVALTGGAESLRYTAKDKSIRLRGAGAANSEDDVADTSANTSAILQNRKVAKACREFPKDMLPALAGVGLVMRGQERKGIVKAMRGWCKNNDIATPRSVGLCISSISKMVVAMKSEVSMSPEELAAAISRGKTVFSGAIGCTKCHQTNGRGGQRGPNLTDDKWLHCDGTIEGIKKVILAGVSTNKLKNASFPSMRATTSLIGQDEDLTDLAAYVHSLSAK